MPSISDVDRIRRSRILVVTASICLVCGLVSLSVSFSTDGWLLFAMPRNISRTGKGYALHPELYHDRQRGLFGTCYSPSENLSWLASMEQYTVWISNKPCLSEQGYDLGLTNSARTDYGPDYQLRTHLLRAHWAFFVLAMTSSLITLTTAVVELRLMTPSLATGVTILNSLTVLLIAAGMAFFHGYRYLEDEQINADIDVLPFFAYIKSNPYFVDILVTPGDGKYYYSYFLGWIAMGLDILASVQYLSVACQLSRVKYLPTSTDRMAARRDVSNERCGSANHNEQILTNDVSPDGEAGSQKVARWIESMTSPTTESTFEISNQNNRKSTGSPQKSAVIHRQTDGMFAGDTLAHTAGLRRHWSPYLNSNSAVPKAGTNEYVTFRPGIQPAAYSNQGAATGCSSSPAVAYTGFNPGFNHGIGSLYNREVPRMYTYAISGTFQPALNSISFPYTSYTAFARPPMPQRQTLASVSDAHRKAACMAAASSSPAAAAENVGDNASRHPVHYPRLPPDGAMICRYT